MRLIRSMMIVNTASLYNPKYFILVFYSNSNCPSKFQLDKHSNENVAFIRIEDRVSKYEVVVKNIFR